MDLRKDGFSDIEKLEALLSKAQTAKNQDGSFKILSIAESLYCGELFSENRFQDEFIVKRDEFKQKYLGILTQLIAFHENEIAYHKCIDLSKKYLKVDKYDEEIYLNLMKLYVKIQNVPMALKIFKNCNDAIVKDLDCPLGEGIKAYHEKIISRSKK